MKKLLAVLSVFSLTATTSMSVVSCDGVVNKTNTKQFKDLENRFDVLVDKISNLLKQIGNEKPTNTEAKQMVDYGMEFRKIQAEGLINYDKVFRIGIHNKYDAIKEITDANYYANEANDTIDTIFLLLTTAHDMFVGDGGVTQENVDTAKEVAAKTKTWFLNKFIFTSTDFVELFNQRNFGKLKESVSISNFIKMAFENEDPAHTTNIPLLEVFDEPEIANILVFTTIIDALNKDFPTNAEQLESSIVKLKDQLNGDTPLGALENEQLTKFVVDKENQPEILKLANPLIIELLSKI